MLRTDDASVVTAFGEAGQGWWSSENDAEDDNVNYALKFSASNSVRRNFLTFDLADPALAGQTIVGATLRLQAFQANGNGTLEFYDVTTDPAVVNNNVGMNPAVFADLGSGVLYGALAIPAAPAEDDILEIALNAAAISALNARLGTGFFVFGGTSNLFNLFFGSTANGNQQLVLETVTLPSAVPLPASLPLLGAGVVFLGILGRRRRRAAA